MNRIETVGWKMDVNKQIHTAEVLDNMEIAPGIRRIGLYAPGLAEKVCPGQFFNIYPDADRLILPRPFGIHRVNRPEHSISFIYEVVGEGTLEMAGKERGSRVRVSEPLGNGFDLTAVKEGEAEKNRTEPAAAGQAAADKADEHAPVKTVLVGGGVGTSVLQFLTEELIAAGAEVTAVLGFRQYPFGTELMEQTGARVLAATDLPHEGAFTGNVCDCMEANGVTGDLYFACGPRPMLKALDGYVRARGDDRTLQVSLDSRMACGYGVCLGCSTPMRVTDEDGQERIVRKRVCKDGPVFRGSEVIW